MCGFLKAWECLKSSASAWGFSEQCQGVCLDEGVLTTGENLRVLEAHYLGDNPSQPFPNANLGERGRGGPRVSRGLRR